MKPAIDPTIRFPPVTPHDYDQPIEWVSTGIIPARQTETPRQRDNTLIAILLAGALLLVYMAKAGAYSEYRAQPPVTEPPAPAITIIDNSWNMCGICTNGNASPHYIQP